jgi:pimeloyl-ACP methyl ester carboxylesterase
MIRALTVVAIMATAAAAATADYARRELGTWIDAGGHRVRMRVQGRGTPAVVFETPGMAPAEAWHRVQPAVARWTRSVSYDHAGYWGSEPGPDPRDGRRIAGELRAALRSAGIPPPYVLVGHSFGGPLVRIFAGAHPEETAGLVLVDPSQEEFFDWMRAHDAEAAAAWREAARRPDELGCSWLTLEAARSATLPPDVPVLLITATGLDATRPRDRAYERVLKQRWLVEHRRWADRHAGVQHRVTNRCGHAVPLVQPQLVVDAVRDVLRQCRRAPPPRPGARP